MSLACWHGGSPVAIFASERVVVAGGPVGGGGGGRGFQLGAGGAVQGTTTKTHIERKRAEGPKRGEGGGGH